MYQFRQNVNGDMIYLISIGSLTSRTWIGFHSPFLPSFSYLRSCRSIVASIVRACRLCLPLRRHRPRPFPPGQQARSHPVGGRNRLRGAPLSPLESRRDRRPSYDFGLGSSRTRTGNHSPLFYTAAPLNLKIGGFHFQSRVAGLTRAV